MNDQKIENLLNLALDASQEEREKSEILETGYDAKERRWEVIIRYSGPLEMCIRDSGIGSPECDPGASGASPVMHPDLRMKIEKDRR